MRLATPNEYFEPQHPVLHAAQGDIYEGVPFVWAQPAPAAPEPRGQRKRALFQRSAQSGHSIAPAVHHDGVLLNYTCSFTAQPPGTRDYAHDSRLVAPIFPLRALREYQVSTGEMRRIRDSGGTNGIMYLPALRDDPTEDEWQGHSAVCLYRATSVTQGLLDSLERINRLSEAGQRILMARLVEQVGGYLPDPFHPDFPTPDRSDSWAL